MAKKKSPRVFIKKGVTFAKFLYAQEASDGSVIIGYPVKMRAGIQFVSDRHLGELRPPDLHVEESEVESAKISFHSSGHYKLTSKVGRTKETMDRATVIGKKLSEIDKPERMAEFLIPLHIPVTGVPVENRDIILDATDAPERPLRCSLFCMSHKEFELFQQQRRRIVDTSVWETWEAIENGTHVWLFALRCSKDEEVYSTGGVFVFGEMKWGNRCFAYEE